MNEQTYHWYQLTYILKTENCHCVNFVGTGGMGGFHYDNFWGHQWWQSWHLDNSVFSTSTTFMYVCVHCVLCCLHIFPHIMLMWNKMLGGSVCSQRLSFNIKICRLIHHPISYPTISYWWDVYHISKWCELWNIWSWGFKSLHCHMMCYCI